MKIGRGLTSTLTNRGRLMSAGGGASINREEGRGLMPT